MWYLLERDFDLNKVSVGPVIASDGRCIVLNDGYVELLGTEDAVSLDCLDGEGICRVERDPLFPIPDILTSGSIRLLSDDLYQIICHRELAKAMGFLSVDVVGLMTNESLKYWWMYCKSTTAGPENDRVELFQRDDLKWLLKDELMAEILKRETHGMEFIKCPVDTE